MKTFSFAPLLILAAKPSAAFVPPATPNRGTYAQTPRQATALQANLLDRFVRVAKGNLNSVLMSLESPEKIMNQAMIDMQNDLVQVRQSYAEITAVQRRLASQRDAQQARAEDWYLRAQLALKSGNEGLAKEALYRRQQYLDAAKNIQTQLDGQVVAADKLFAAMRAFEGKIQEAQQRKSEFVARAKAAESTQKVNDMLSGLTGKTSMDAFRRMEEKVEALEAAAEASAALVGILPSGDEIKIEKEFLMLESSEAVDKEFQKLKTKVLKGTSVDKVFAPSIEKEFAKLKSDVVQIPVQVR